MNTVAAFTVDKNLEKLTAPSAASNRWSRLSAALQSATNPLSSAGEHSLLDRTGGDAGFDDSAAAPLPAFVPSAMTAAEIGQIDEALALAAQFVKDDGPDVSAALETLPPDGLEAVIGNLILEKAPAPLLKTILDLSEALETHNHLKSARWVMSRLAKAMPTFYWPVFVLGRIALNGGEAEVAQRYLNRAIALDPQFGWSHFLLYRAYFALGRRAEAGEHLDTAIGLLPELREKTAAERLQFLPRLRWTPLHDELLAGARALGPLSEPIVDNILDIAGSILTHAFDNAETSEVFAQAAENLFKADSDAAPDFRLTPLLYVAAILVERNDVDRAARLLSEFQRRFPERIDYSMLPRHFMSVMQSATDMFLKSFYVSDWPRPAARNNFCLLLAELQYGVFHNPGTARILVEAAAVGAHTSANNYGDYLRLHGYASENKWFEVADIIASHSRKDVLASPQFVRSYVSALAAVSEGAPSLMLTAVRQALALAHESPSPWEAMDGIIDKLHVLLRDAMSQMYERTKAAALAGDRALALALWEKGHAEACDLIEACEELVHSGPAPVRDRAAQGEVLVLTSPYLPQVLHYRGEQLCELFESVDISAPLIDLVQTPILSLQMRALGARAVVLQRQPATFAVMRFIAWCRQMKIPVLYDIDDQIFDSAVGPPPLSDYAGRIDRAVHVDLQFDCSYFRQALNRCDAVIVSTAPLARQVEAVLAAPKPIYLRRNMVGEPLRVARLETYAARLAKAKARERDRQAEFKAKVEIFYGSGTKAHKAYFDDTVLPALVEVARVRENASITLLGDFDLINVPADVARQFTCERKTLGYRDYLSRLAQADISIAPLNLTPITDVKSELKWFEAAFLGVASVVSPTANYCDAVEGGRHALFADTQEEWRGALLRLVDDAQLRQNLVEQSAELIERNYQIANMARPTIEAMGLLRAAEPDVRRRTRVLVANTYFRPQSIGGATRIAEAYAFDLARRYGDRFEVFALCADAKHRASTPYLVTAMRHDNVTVLRCAVPTRDWADPLDSQIEAIADGIARDLEIDVVHAHSVQILTASVVEGFVKAGVPVLLSLHDAWWLSEHQFLVDEDGKAFQPRHDFSDFYETTCQRMPAAARIRRRTQLARILRLCARRLSVSEAFAEVYRQAGVAKVEVLENGMALPKAPPPRPAAKPGAPLRIGFIGGLSAHKGLRLLEGVVRSETFARLEFVLVDHRYEQGYEREDRWGASRVTYIGKTPQSRVAEVYARFDVLAAVSIWPESYGLVAREARAYGVAVIAGDRGDIARGIEPGRDGWVIDVADDADLRALLRRLDADPDRGRLTPAAPQVQSVEQSVDRLATMLAQAIR